MKKKKYNSFTDGYRTYDPETEGFGSSWEWRQSFHEKMESEEVDQVLGRTPEETPWDILGVLMNATEAQVKAAFRKLLMKWHPDKNPKDQEEHCTEMSKKIIAAYTKITGG